MPNNIDVRAAAAGATKKKWSDILPKTNLSSAFSYMQDFLNVLALVLVPWMLFFIISILFTFAYHGSHVVVWICCLFAVLFSVALIGAGVAGGKGDDDFDRAHQSGASVQLMLGLLCFLATFLATALGYYSYHEYMFAYWSYQSNGEYTNLMPSELAAAHADAGKIIFSDFSRVDTTRAAGWKDGPVYCVAPVLDDVPVAKVEYWAVGKDCCAQRADFNCDDAWNPKAKSGMVVLDSSPWKESDHDHYMKAVGLAESTFDIISAKEPIFVRWVAEPEVVQDDFWRSGIGFLVAEVSIYFLASVIFGIICGGTIQRSAPGKRMGVGA